MLGEEVIRVRLDIEGLEFMPAGSRKGLAAAL